MKAGDTFEQKGKTYVATLNMVQILTGEDCCTGCDFGVCADSFKCQRDADSRIFCNHSGFPPDQQFIFKEVANENSEHHGREIPQPEARETARNVG